MQTALQGVEGLLLSPWSSRALLRKPQPLLPVGSVYGSVGSWPGREGAEGRVLTASPLALLSTPLPRSPPWASHPRPPLASLAPLGPLSPTRPAGPVSAPLSPSQSPSGPSQPPQPRSPSLAPLGQLLSSLGLI